MEWIEHSYSRASHLFLEPRRRTTAIRAARASLDARSLARSLARETWTVRALRSFPTVLRSRVVLVEEDAIHLHR